MCIILVKKQYGFRITSSIEAASYNVINEISKAMTFSRRDILWPREGVNHGILVNKLEFYGTSGIFLTLIQSYPRERYQKLFIDIINAYDSISSRWKKVTNAVPQGAILGPLLFVIYVNIYPK